MRTVFSLLLVCLVVPSAWAADYDVGLRHLIVSTSSDVVMESSRGFAATGEAFFTPAVSAELAIAFANPAAEMDDVDLGTLGLQTTSVTARWNLRPEASLSFFAGAGPAIVSIGNLDDQFGDAIDVEFDRELTFVAEAGVRYRVPRIPRLHLVANVAYMPLTAKADVRRGTFPAELELDPTTWGIGATWRF